MDEASGETAANSADDQGAGDAYQFVRPIDDHPIPFDQASIDERWADHEPDTEPPSVDEAHDEYVRTIANRGEWHVFRAMYPFGYGDRVIFWNGTTGEAFTIDDSEGSWHEIVNLFAEIVETEGDCRDADYSSSLMQSGGYNQRCRNCGGSWVIG